MITEYTTMEEAFAVPDPKHIWWDVDKAIVFTGEDIPEEPLP